MNPIQKQNTLKFRCRLETSNGTETHREFSGGYFPRWRGLYLDEIREVGKEVKLSTLFPFDVYLKPDGDYYYTRDFEMGATFTLGYGNNVRDYGLAKKFVITKVDDARLQVSTGVVKAHFAKNIPEDVVEDLMAVRDAFIRVAGDVPELGIKALGRRFRIMDDNGDRKISPAEFKEALIECRVEMSDERIARVFKAFDANSDGIVSFEELIKVIRGPMSEVRRQAVIRAFHVVDVNKDGVVSLGDIRAKYNAKNHPEVLSGHLSEDDVLKGFITIWDTKDMNGTVTFDEFEDYYNGISALIDDDRYFVEVVAASWKLW